MRSVHIAGIRQRGSTAIARIRQRVSAGLALGCSSTPWTDISASNQLMTTGSLVSRDRRLNQAEMCSAGNLMLLWVTLRLICAWTLMACAHT